MIERHTIRSVESPVVVDVSDYGARPVSVLETTSRTFVGAGYLHHNCSYDLPWSAGKLRQRNGRIDRLSSEFPQITLLDQQMAGSVEERQYHIVHEKIRVGEAVIDRKGVDDKGGLNLDVLTLHGFLQDSIV